MDNKKVGMNELEALIREKLNIRYNKNSKISKRKGK
jgi:hypothetical protein